MDGEKGDWDPVQTCELLYKMETSLDTEMWLACPAL